jgi:tetratricopeptide (TPR) repeat protein
MDRTVRARQGAGMSWTGFGSACALAIVVAAAACAPRPAPVATPGPVTARYPAYPHPDVPAALAATPDLVAQHEAAWQRLQSGDYRTAEREFQAILRASPNFYPAETGLGFAYLAARDFRRASFLFTLTLGRNDRYVPAWHGQVEARLGVNDEDGAIIALERLTALEASDAVRTRLDLLKLRRSQALAESGRRAREAGRLDEALASLEAASTLSPANVAIQRELALVRAAQGQLEEAERHARRAIELDATDAESSAVLGGILESQKRYAEAAAAFAAAARIDPRPAWVERAETLRARAAESAVPAEFRALPTAETVTRAQLAAVIGMRLEPVLARAMSRPAAIATDVRGHWAETWIVMVTQAGVMDVAPNHTFQPATQVRRSDLANVVSELLALVAAERRTELAQWRAARPRFLDLPATNVYYPAAALAVASGAMKPVEGRFASTRPATGADVIAAIGRLAELAGR